MNIKIKTQPKIVRAETMNAGTIFQIGNREVYIKTDEARCVNLATGYLTTDDDYEGIVLGELEITE